MSNNQVQNQKDESLSADKYDPLAHFSILHHIKWDEKSINVLRKEWSFREPRGMSLPEIVHALMKIVPNPNAISIHDKRIFVRKIISFFEQVDYQQSGQLTWKEFLDFITSCSVFDHEKTRVDTVVNYQFEKEIDDKTGSFTVIRFLYDFSHDTLFSFNANGFIQMYSADSLTLIKKIRLFGRPINSVTDGALIPDKSLLAVIYPTGIQIISIYGGINLAQEIQTTSNAQLCIMYDNDTHSLLTGTENKKIYVWQPENWNEKQNRMNWRPANILKTEYSVTSISGIPGSSAFASGDSEGNLLIWDKFNFRLLRTIRAHRAPIHTIIHSENLNAIVTSAYDIQVMVWNPFIPFLMNKLECPTGVVTAMTVLPDSQHLIVADRSGALHIANLRTMLIVQTFQISPYGQFAQQVVLTKATEQQLDKSLVLTGAFPITALSHCGIRKRFVLGGRMLRFYEYEENCLPSVSSRFPIRKAILNTKFHVIALATDNHLQHWSPATGEMLLVFRKITQSQITAMCLDPTERYLFIGCHSTGIVSFHFPTGQLMHEIGKFPNEVTALIFSEQLDCILASRWGGVVSFLQHREDGRMFDLSIDNKDVDFLCLTLSGKYLAAGTSKGKIILWNLDDLKVLSVLEPRVQENLIVSLSFVPNSTLLVCSDSEGYITFWNYRPCQAITQLPNFYIDSTNSTITSLCVFNQLLITGDQYGELRLWDISQLISHCPKQDDSPSPEIHRVFSTQPRTVYTSLNRVPVINAKKYELPIGSFQLLLKWKAHLNAITSISTFYTDNQDVVLTSSSDCSAAVWALKQGTTLGFLQSYPKYGHPDREWKLQYDLHKSEPISIERISKIITSSEGIQTPKNSPRNK